RHTACDVGPLHDERGVAQAGLDVVTRAPIGRPAVTQIELSLPVRVPEYEEVDHVLVTVRPLDRACPAGAPGFLVLLLPAFAGPARGDVPGEAGYDELIPAVIVGVDEAPAT